MDWFLESITRLVSLLRLFVAIWFVLLGVIGIAAGNYLLAFVVGPVSGLGAYILANISVLVVMLPSFRKILLADKEGREEFLSEIRNRRGLSIIIRVGLGAVSKV
jgi:ACR3 family arsenite efflux pump ArsB